MAGAKRFEELHAWQEARLLAREIRRLCRRPAFKREFAFQDQVGRAAISVMNNVAEGFARKTHAEFARFLDIARGSATEVQSMLYLAADDNLIDEGEFKALYSQAEKTIAKIGSLTSYLRKA